MGIGCAATGCCMTGAGAIGIGCTIGIAICMGGMTGIGCMGRIAGAGARGIARASSSATARMSSGDEAMMPAIRLRLLRALRSAAPNRAGL